MKKAALLIFFVFASPSIALADQVSCEFKLGLWQRILGVKLQQEKFTEAQAFIADLKNSGDYKRLLLAELTDLASSADPHLYLALIGDLIPELKVQEQRALLDKERWRFPLLKALWLKWRLADEAVVIKRLDFFVAKMAHRKFFNDVIAQQSLIYRYSPWGYSKNRRLAELKVYKYLFRLKRSLDKYGMAHPDVVAASKMRSALGAYSSYALNALSTASLMLGVTVLGLLVWDGHSTNQQIEVQQEQYEELYELNQSANPEELLNQLQNLESQE